ncbi:hypothetical protein ACIBQ1_01825 [Nonomuraea sp. NPDC050153]|uniref:hypothetical protein n=1 Tax=Nonomuraea sp. NPDC050153 TaxID=3364359 RepID=UPI0037B2BBEB
MSMLDQIPVISDAPRAGRDMPRPAAASGQAAALPLSAPGRRTFLRTAIIGGTALAMTSLGWIADRMPAFAVSRTTRHASHCMGVSVSGDTPCWGRTSISSTHCASDHYHRTDTGGSGSSFWYDYNWVAACGGAAGWYWSSSAGKWNCWDGEYDQWVSGSSASGYTTICKYKYA